MNGGSSWFLLGSLLFLTVIQKGYFLEPAPEEQSGADRESKLLPIFQVVRFPNEICDGGSRNGTCYTAEECSSKGGTSSGQCASGFGVCCIFALSCGGSSSENATYLSQSGVTTLTSPCTYTICKCSSNICRIRFDFNTFVIAAQTNVPTLAADAASTKGSAAGDCVTDSFSITAPGHSGSPVICGTNSGSHMILDASDDCHSANFMIGGDTGTTRQWDILVTQYSCDQDDVSGPPGCLQYYTSTQNIIQNYGFTTSSTVTSSVTHLSSQNYNICIRRASGYCYICYSPTISGAAIIAQISFGLSISSDAAAKSAIDTRCSTDYIVIPGGNTQAIAAILKAADTDANRFCGRIFSIADADDTITITVCTQQTPFVVGVNFDGDEPGGATALLGDHNLFPGGITGFKLTYFQRAC